MQIVNNIHDHQIRSSQWQKGTILAHCKYTWPFTNAIFFTTGNGFKKTNFSKILLQKLQENLIDNIIYTLLFKKKIKQNADVGWLSIY